MKSTYLLYDRDRIQFDVPESWQILEPPDPPSIPDVEAAIEQALAEPVGTRPLLELARAADKAGHAVIVISDITRAVPNQAFLPAILDTLARAGFERDKIIILIATGMHRPSTHAERIELVGPEIADSYHLVDHLSEEATSLVELPAQTSSGASVGIDATYYDAGLRIVTGFIEPHFMAGFSGGRKSICPGLVDLRTVQRVHGPQFLGDPNAATDILDGNPCHRESLEVAKMVPPDFIFNVTVNSQGRIAGIFAGELEQAHLAGVEFVRRYMTVEVARPFEAVFISGGGYPLDTTFYQTVKAMVVANDYLERAGRIVIASGCAQGIGSEIYTSIMFKYADDYEKFIDDIFSRDEVLKDQWQFQMHCRVLERTGREGLMMITDGIPLHELRRCNVTPGEDLLGRAGPAKMLAKMVERISEQTSNVAIVPRGPYIIPKVLAR